MLIKCELGQVGFWINIAAIWSLFETISITDRIQLDQVKLNSNMEQNHFTQSSKNTYGLWTWPVPIHVDRNKIM